MSKEEPIVNDSGLNDTAPQLGKSSTLQKLLNQLAIIHSENTKINDEFNEKLADILRPMREPAESKVAELTNVETNIEKILESLVQVFEKEQAERRQLLERIKL